MTFRDDREAAHQRAAVLEEQLDQARAELASLRERLARHEASETRDEREIASLRAQIDRTARLLGMPAPRRRRGPLIAAGVAVAALAAMFGVIYVVAYRVAAPQSLKPVVAIPPALPTPAEPPRPAPTVVEPTPAPASTPPVALVWHGRVAEAQGVALRAGTPCVVEASIGMQGHDADASSIEVRCGTTALYRSSDELGTGMESTETGLSEGPAPDGAGWLYVLRYVDQGTRSGPRAQTDIETERHEARVWREGAEPMSVAIDLRDVSDARAGERLMPWLTFTTPSARSGFERAARVLRVGGAAPVAAGARCTVALRPSWIEQDECRIAVRCGATWLYGARTTGYAHCASENGRPFSAEDTNPSSHGGDPMFNWRGDAATVADDGADGTWWVHLALGAPLAGP